MIRIYMFKQGSEKPEMFPAKSYDEAFAEANKIYLQPIYLGNKPIRGETV